MELSEQAANKYEDVRKAQIELTNMQTRTIGLARPTAVRGLDFECIIDKDGTLLTLFSVGNLLGSSSLHIEESHCEVYYFPEGKTLYQMMQDPLKFNDWYKMTIMCSNLISSQKESTF